MESKKLALGSGLKNYDGYIRVDINSLSNPDVVQDLNVFPYPFSDDEFDEIIAEHVVEHLNDFFATLQELHRIIKPGGKITIITPHYSSLYSWTDPTHKTHLSSFSLDFWGHGYYSQAKFKTSVKVSFPYTWRRFGIEKWVNSSEKARSMWERHFSFIFRALDLEFILYPVKPLA